MMGTFGLAAIIGAAAAAAGGAHREAITMGLIGAALLVVGILTRRGI